MNASPLNRQGMSVWAAETGAGKGDVRATAAGGELGSRRAGEDGAEFVDAGVVLKTSAMVRLGRAKDGRWERGDRGLTLGFPGCGIATALIRPTAVARAKRMEEAYMVGRYGMEWYGMIRTRGKDEKLRR